MALGAELVPPAELPAVVICGRRRLGRVLGQEAPEEVEEFILATGNRT